MRRRPFHCACVRQSRGLYVHVRMKTQFRCELKICPGASCFRDCLVCKISTFQMLLFIYLFIYLFTYLLTCLLTYWTETLQTWTAKRKTCLFHEIVPYYFGFEMPSCLIKNKFDKFILRYNCVENVFCKHCYHCYVITQLVVLTICYFFVLSML